MGRRQACHGWQEAGWLVCWPHGTSPHPLLGDELPPPLACWLAGRRHPGDRCAPHLDGRQPEMG